MNACPRRHMADATLALHALANICKKNMVLSDGRLSFFFNAMNLLSLHLVGVESFIGTLLFYRCFFIVAFLSLLFYCCFFNVAFSRLQDDDRGWAASSFSFAI